MPNQLSPLGVRGQVLPLGIRRGGAVSWWLSGGIAAANCVAAYQPKGAADLAGSYINLANPGTYNAAPGTAPTWDVINGWKFAGASSQYLTCGITPAGNQTWSIIAKYTNVTGSFGWIAIDSGLSLGIRPLNPPSAFRSYFAGGQTVNVSVVNTGGVMALAGRQPYFNCATDGGLISAGSSTPTTILIGCYATSYFFIGYLQELAIYNTILTAPQILALTNAMNAL
jgi:hypothetical protein